MIQCSRCWDFFAQASTRCNHAPGSGGLSVENHLPSSNRKVAGYLWGCYVRSPSILRSRFSPGPRKTACQAYGGVVPAKRRRGQ